MTQGKDRKPLPIQGLPAHEQVRLLAVATGRSITQLRGDAALTPAEAKRFDELMSRRLAGEPLQYLEGLVPFAGVEVKVDRRVFIPRQETEYLAGLVASDGRRPSVVVDLCTGSGVLALALKRRWPEARVIGTDISPAALDLAAENGQLNQLEVEWLVGDLFEPLPKQVLGTVEVLVANPPYVREEDWDSLPTDVRREPRLGLVAGMRGTEVIEAILDGIEPWLAPGGVAWMEVGDGQANMLTKHYPVEAVRDQYEVPRYLRLTKSA